MPDEETPEAAAAAAEARARLGRAIRLLRTAREMSRRDLSEGAGLSYSYLSEIETGKKLPSTRALGAIATALGMAPHDLMATAAKWGRNYGLSEDRVEEAREWAESPQGYASRRAPPLSPESGNALAALEDAMRAANSDPETFTASEAPGPCTSAFSEPEMDIPTFAKGPSASQSRPGEVPPALLAEIEAGNCVAFVGAGFAAAGNLPTWGELLEGMCEYGDERVHDIVAQHVAQGTAHALGEAAQVLEDYLGRENFIRGVRLALIREPTNHDLRQRVNWLHEIPFRAILTTNFDPSLAGAIPSHEAYRQALRPDGDRWWNPRYWNAKQGAFTLKLHGDLYEDSPAAEKSVILTRRDYRRRLYEDPGYATFLRSIMATNTILYMGFSFEDAYLNELRSEILSLLGQRRDSTPVAYAIVNDVPDASRAHFRHHEGIELLTYDTDSGRDFRGFDRYLSKIHAATNPLLRFAGYLESKRILWLDPHPENNEIAFAHLARAAKLAKREESALVTAATAEEAIRALEEAATSEPFDVVITHFGGALADEGERGATAVQLLMGMRSRDIRCPVIVFAAAHEVEERKRAVLGLGAQAYCHSFEGLYRALERVLGPGESE